VSHTADDRSDEIPEDEIFFANRAIRRAKAVHEAVGVLWATWGPNGVKWIPPEALPDLPFEDRGELPTTSAPRTLPTDTRRRT